MGREQEEELIETQGGRATLTEAFIFKLSKQLGGREEVLNTPAIEAFKYMQMAIEEDEAKAKREAEKFFMDFISNMYAQSPTEGEKPEFTQGRRQFIETIKPQKQIGQAKKQGKDEPARFAWPEHIQKALEEGG